MIKVLDICSGIGGFSLGLESTGKYERVAFCENEPFCKKVLNKHWPDVPIYNDLKELGNDPEKIQEEFDLICGGIPCQPFSVAGRKKGKKDDRHLWPYMFEIIKQKTPTWVIVENVGGFVNVALDDVCLDLETEGYATQSFIIPACGIEAPHRRDRVWIIGKSVEDTRCTLRQGAVEQGTNENEVREGDANKLERSSSTPELNVADTKELDRDVDVNGHSGQGDGQQRQGLQRELGGESSISGEDMANTNTKGLQRGQKTRNFEESRQGREQLLARQSEFFRGKNWESEPAVGRVANGIPNRVDRLKALGNAIVPQIIYNIGIAIANEEVDKFN